MSECRAYLYIQLRRALKFLPVLMAVTLILWGCVGIFAVIYLSDDTMAENNQKYRLAIVGDTSNTYLGFGISALSVLDDSRFMVEFYSMTEGEARSALAAGEITAYAIIPEDLIDSIVSGANDSHITIVGATAQKGITGILIEELSEVVSTLVVRSQSAIFGMQRVLRDNGMGDQWWEATTSLNLRFIEMVLNRTGLCDLEVLGMANGLSATGYYFCSMMIFFLLMAGINNSPLFGKKSRELMRLMASRGVGAFRQVAGEYLAYLFLNLCCLAGVFLVVGLVYGSGVIQIDEWKRQGAGILAVFFFRMLPVTAALTAMQFMMYELVSGIVSSIILQFVCGISMAYLSGCFYPASIFPDILRHIGEMLPTGLALRYADESLTGGIPLWTCFGLLFYIAAFLGASVFARRLRIQKG